MALSERSKARDAWVMARKRAVTSRSDTTCPTGTQPAAGAQPLATQANTDDMAKVEYAFPVDKVHGKISKKHKVGFAHRKASAKNYTTAYGERTTAVKETELAARAKFKAVVLQARERMLDPNHADMDQLNFSRQDKYTTLFGYVFRQVWDSYEE
jgi:hypothetical protein